MTGQRICFYFGGDPVEAKKKVEYALCILVFDTSNPLHASMHSDFDFTAFPAPTIDQFDRCVLEGILPYDLANLVRFHPDTRMSRGIIKADLSAQAFLLFLENAYLTYLSSFKTKKIRLPKGL